MSGNATTMLISTGNHDPRNHLRQEERRFEIVVESEALSFHAVPRVTRRISRYRRVPETRVPGTIARRCAAR